MLGVEPKRFAAALAAVVVAIGAGTARADSAPGTFSGHGVSFSYPTDWLNMPGEILGQQGGAPLWNEFFGPVPAAPTPPPGSTSPPPQSTGSADVVGLASYHIPYSITKKNIARYKALVRLSTQTFLAQFGGKIVRGPIRVTMGGLPGYRVDVTATVRSVPVEGRIVFAFRGRYDYFLNCQNTLNGQFSAEIKSGCDQIMQSFQLVPGS